MTKKKQIKKLRKEIKSLNKFSFQQSKQISDYSALSAKLQKQVNEALVFIDDWKELYDDKVEELKNFKVHNGLA